MSRRSRHTRPINISNLQLELLRIKKRMEQVKLRRLEWATSRYALPHITPLPGDTEAQIRTPPAPIKSKTVDAKPVVQTTQESAPCIPWDPADFGQPITALNSAADTEDEDDIYADVHAVIRRARETLAHVKRRSEQDEQDTPSP